MTDGVTGRPPRSRMAAGRSLAISSVFLVLGKGVQMGTGFLFWVVAARSAEVSEVGLAVATVSGVLLCTQLALLGVGSAVIAQLPRKGEEGSGLLDTGFTIVLVSGALVGFGYLAITAGFSPDLHAVFADPGYAALFVVAAVFGTAMICFDQVSVAIGKAHQQATRYVVTGVLTVGLVLAVGAAVGHVSAAPLFACWAVGSVVACAIGAIQLARSIGYRFRPTRDRRRARRLLGVGIPNQLLTLTERLPPLLVPVLVADLIAPEVSAYWYPVWMTAWGIYIAPIMVGLVQFAHIVRHPEGVRATAAAALRWSLVIGGPLAVVVAVVAEPLLNLLGSAYAEASVTALRVLVLGLLPYALIQSYNSVCRALNRLREAIIVGILGAAAACAATVVAGMRGDVTTMAVGWVGTQGVVACWAAVRLWAFTAHERASSPDSADAASATPGALRPAVPAMATAGAVTDRAVGAPEPTRGGPPSGRAVVAVPDPRRSDRSSGPPHLPDGPSAHPPVGRWRLAPAAVLAAAIGIAGAVLCVAGARGSSLGQIGDAGLAEVLGWRFWIGFALMQCTFFVAMGVRSPSWLLGLLTTGLVLAVYGAAAFAASAPRGEATWRHLGIVDYLAQGGSIDASIDAYFGWPGFFALFAVFGKATGLPLTQVALWAPVWINVLWLLGLAALVSQITPDRHHVWLTIWVFASVNWIDQDYFAPQAFAFLLYLVILALVLRLLRAHSPRTAMKRLRAAWEHVPWRGRTTGSGPALPDRARPVADRARGLLLVTVLSTAMIASHQLTPFALLVAVTALVLVGAVATPRLPVILFLILTAWLVLPASGYLDGHPVLNAENLASTVGDNLTDRIIGSDERLFVLRLRMMLTAAVWVLAAVGLVRRWRAGHRDAVCLALAVAPFVLLPAQSYGGEMLLRVSLFSLPFAGFFAAAALLPSARGRTAGRAGRILRAALIAVLGSVLGAASVGARYGNARFDIFTPGDIAGVQALYTYARAGDVLITGAHPTPWRYRDYDAHRYLALQDLCKAPNLTAEGCFKLVDKAVRASPSDRGLILVNRANREAIRMQNLLPAEMLRGVEERLVAAPAGRLIAATHEFRLYELRIDWGGS